MFKTMRLTTAIFLLSFGGEAFAQADRPAIVVSSCGGGSLTAGLREFVRVDVTGRLCTDAGSGVAVTQGTSPWVVSGGGTAGSAATGVVTVQGIASMTPLGVSAASGAFASGSIASGAIASGAVASGAYASGAFASGSFASGSQRIGITPTDRTVTSATGASQTVMSALATRKALTIVNTGNANCGVNPTGGTAAIGGAGTLTLAPLGSYTPATPTLSAITAICTAGQPLYADEG